MVTVAQLLTKGVKKLKDAGLETPQLDAEVLLCRLLGEERIQLHIYPEKEISQEITEKYWDAIEKRSRHMPVPYIICRQEFMGLDFYVKDGVLIPRCDTEILVEEVLRLYQVNYAPAPVKAVDIGTGSGAISVSLAKYIGLIEVISIDISRVALEVAKYNAYHHGVDHKITFFEGSLLEPLYGKGFEETFHFIVSNPPYIPTKEIEDLLPQVKSYEPKLALDGGEDGLYFYREIIREAPKFMELKGWLVFEIGYDQGRQVQKLMEDRGFNNIQIIQDLAGLDRVVMGQKWN